jgi:hypothetical protein
MDAYTNLGGKVAGYGRIEFNLACLRYTMIFFVTVGIIALIIGSMGLEKAKHPPHYTINDFMEDGTLNVDGSLSVQSVDIVVPSASEGVTRVLIDSSLTTTKYMKLDTSAATANSFRVVAYRISISITVSVGVWEGNCSNTTNHLIAGEALPIEFVQFTDGIASDCAPELVSTLNNGKEQIGLVFLDSQGQLVFYPNAYDSNEKWQGQCGANSFNLSFLGNL